MSGNGIMGAMVMGDPYQNPLSDKIMLLLYLPIHSAKKPVGQGKIFSKIQQMLLEDKFMEAQFVVDLANSEGYNMQQIFLFPLFNSIF